ncbi:hypothetical protein MPL1_08898 [Methylophaga lonarensis MPL]|uniref:DUF1989 domain-containing protein n=1 Tax=Methylophaga lonarensis MPL TaxID=1286106 RepID=M7PQK3_9GAMM|nr:urea amidolyase associated protein UAAP1 [Methylophaga lonarensis]EMR12724.1 hypothetical protein MPL1_08898 [Methylophaga lonarensis MPL]
MLKTLDYTTTIAGGGHWSIRMARGTAMRLTDLNGTGNVGMLFYNPENLLERYNAPDTLKCQHTFKLNKGHCLYSDMGRIFASIVEDSLGWHDTVCGNSTPSMTEQRWGKRDYQHDRNHWHQNGHDAFLVELAKYGLTLADMAANVNWFSKVVADDSGVLSLSPNHSVAGSQLTLRFEMDTLVMLHTCPHPLDMRTDDYPAQPVKIELGLAEPVQEDDFCKNFRPENQRGFQNNALYYLGR